MAAAAPPPLDPAVMIDEIVEEFLLLLPPEYPELLARAALVSRQWYRVVTGPSFRRRFCKLHRSTPQLLGYVKNRADSVHFVRVRSFRPPGADRPGVRAVGSSHGRILLHRLSEEDPNAPRFPVRDVSVHLSVWHPVTGEQQDLPRVPLRPNRSLDMPNWDAAVVCASGDDDCDHLHCHFKVVFVGSRQGRNYSCIYTSEAGGWSDPVFSPEVVDNFHCFVPGNLVLAGTTLYRSCAATNEVFKYDLQTQQMSNVAITHGPRVPPDIIGIGQCLCSVNVVPYEGFWTPAQVAGVAISSNEMPLPVAGMAVSTDEGSGSGVAVSVAEGAGAGGMCQVPNKKLKL